MATLKITKKGLGQEMTIFLLISHQQCLKIFYKNYERPRRRMDCVVITGKVNGDRHPISHMTV